MPRARMHRRTVLRGLLGASVVSVALPGLDYFFDPPLTARADCAAFPKRFGIWYWGNGVLPDKFRPIGEGSDFTLSEQLMPLAPMRDKISVISGTRVLTPNTVPHGSGPSGLLAGGDMSSPDGNASSGTFPGPGIDQIIANSVGGETLFPSLELGVQRSAQSISFRGPNAMNPPETSPAMLFSRLFGASFREPGAMSEPDPRLGLRQSVLDVVHEQAAGLTPRLGVADRARMEAHLDGIRSIELRIARLQADPASLAACMRPEMPLEAYPDLEGRPQMALVSDVMADLLAMALACDQSRVFTVMYSQSVNNVLYGDHSAGHHQLTHDEPGDQPEVNDIVKNIMGSLNGFLSRMDQIVEGDQTLLDHSAVLCTTDVSLGRTHSLEDYPLVLAGSCCGAFRTGIHYRSPGAENACRLSLSLLRAMGVLAPSFGAGPSYTTSGLSGVEV